MNRKNNKLDMKSIILVVATGVLLATIYMMFSIMSMVDKIFVKL